MMMKVTQLCPTLCNPMAYTVHGILQASILEWVAFPIQLVNGKARLSIWFHNPVQFSSVAQSCLTLCNPMNRRCQASLSITNSQSPPKPMPIELVMLSNHLSHPLSSPSPPALNLSQHQSLLKWVRSSQQVAIVLEFQLQYQSFKWTPRTDLL